MTNKKIKKEKKIAGTITVNVQRVGEEEMYLTKHFGNGSLGKTKFDAGHTIPNMSLVVTANGQKFLVSSQEVITKIVELSEKK